MNPNTITTNLQQVVGSDAAFCAWCEAQYASQPTVMVGINQENLPPEDEFPLVVISPGDMSGGVKAEQKDYVYAVSFAVVDDAAPVRNGNLLTYQQVFDLETGRQLVVAALAGADLDGGYVSEVQVENEPVEFFPYFVANMAVTIERPRGFREDRLI